MDFTAALSLWRRAGPRNGCAEAFRVPHSTRCAYQALARTFARSHSRLGPPLSRLAARAAWPASARLAAGTHGLGVGGLAGVGADDLRGDAVAQFAAIDRGVGLRGGSRPASRHALRSTRLSTPVWVDFFLNCSRPF